MTQTMFIHVWKYTDGTDLVLEQSITTTIEGSVKQYYQEDVLGLEYQYTLHTVLDYMPYPGADKCDMVRKTDIRIFLSKDKMEANDNERLTGHEMGICPGRL
ncbi:MAG: hypothetical protein V3V81_07600 [Candidatus Bathyarchaeia archaeon]